MNGGETNGWRWSVTDGILALDNKPLLDAAFSDHASMPEYYRVVVPLTVIHQIVGNLEILPPDPSVALLPQGTTHIPALIADEFGISRSEARRLLEQDGVALDGSPIKLVDWPSEQLDGKTLRVGSRRSRKLRIGS